MRIAMNAKNDEIHLRLDRGSDDQLALVITSPDHEVVVEGTLTELHRLVDDGLSLPLPL